MVLLPLHTERELPVEPVSPPYLPTFPPPSSPLVPPFELRWCAFEKEIVFLNALSQAGFLGFRFEQLLHEFSRTFLYLQQ